MIFAAAIEGDWIATEHGVLTTFQGGRFTTRHLASNTILAEGSYSTVAGNQIVMEWTSARTEQKLSASCKLSGAAVLSCEQEGSKKINFQRVS
jgi:hypothetical protein